ncbi:MAG TPA: TasA family protein [Nocardioides sp.]|uniref:TasA family protein n=1 Tax=Nocardioides sp. TaxID=35761 RepID=UPI002D7F7C3A|nr:TasA family protein [Nocardioides sp.]HET6651826.1 TasA family protein [Nocardioides sp.]
MNGTTSRKVLVPLATLLAAGAVAVGSGATFSSQSANAASTVTSGTLLQSNSKAGAQIFGLSNLKPGDVVNGSVVIKNTGTLPGTFTLRETSSANAFDADMLKLTITDGAKTLYTGNFGGLADNELVDLGQYAAGASKTYTFSVALDATAPNTQQDRTASASYEWVATQLDGGTTNQ